MQWVHGCHPLKICSCYFLADDASVKICWSEKVYISKADFLLHGVWILRLVRSDLKREKINALNIFISGRSCTTKLKIYLTLINSLYYCGITHFHSSRACNCLINYGNAATYSMSPGMEISSKACPLSSFILYTFDKGKVNLQLFYLG